MNQQQEKTGLFLINQVHSESKVSHGCQPTKTEDSPAEAESQQLGS